MVSKRAFHWNKTFKFLKGKLFKRKPSVLNISVSRLDVPVTPFMPVFPQQDRCNRIKNSVARLALRENDPSTDTYYVITPVMIFKGEKGSCRLVYVDCGLDWTGGSMKLIFPDKQILDLLPMPTDVTKRETEGCMPDELFTLVELSCNTSVPSEPFGTIEFGENVEMNQPVFLFDFRYGQPSVTAGTVAFADSTHFIFDAKPHDQYLYGSLVFDVNDKLVGLVCGHAGSLKAIQVNYLKWLLSQMLPKDAQASTMDAAADTTLVFARNKLDKVYIKISPFIVSVKLDSKPDAVGFVIRQTSECYKIAVQSIVMRSEVQSVKFANKKVSPVDEVQVISPMITILYVKRRGGEPLLGKFDDADPTDNMCEKVVTFFPYMDGVAMFKGHIISNDSTRREKIPAVDFTFTCPYATTYEFTGKDQDTKEKLKTLLMTVGAPIFTLEGIFLGVLTDSGKEYDVKLAMNSSNFYNHLPEEIMEDERKRTKDKHEEGDRIKGAKDKKSNSKDDTKHRKDNHKEGDAMKGAKKGKKSNSKDGRKHRKDKHEEEDGQYFVGSDIAHCVMARHDDAPMIDKETKRRLGVVNMDKRGKDSVKDRALDPTDHCYKRRATFMRKQAGKKGAGTSDC